MRYSVTTIRDAGLEARWGRMSNGAPIMFARDPNAEGRHQRESWWAVDDVMWTAMKRDGVRKGFDSATRLGDFFSVPA